MCAKCLPSPSTLAQRRVRLHLLQLCTEFALLSASIVTHNLGSGDLFFANIEFAESQLGFFSQPDTPGSGLPDRFDRLPVETGQIQI